MKEHDCTCRCTCHEHHEHESACPHCEEKLHMSATFDKGMLVRMILTAVLFVPLLFMKSGWISLVCYLALYLLIGADVLYSALRNLLRGRVFDEQLLMALATIGAFAVREYPEALAVMLLYQLGEFLQALALGRSRRNIAALMEIRPDVAVVLREGKECVVPPDEVLVGEIIVLRAGERVPLDGIVTEGETTIDNAALTGESIPVLCGVGDRVISGGVNVGGLIYIKVESTYRESTVARVLTLAENASERKSHVECFITRFSRYYTPVVVSLAALVAFLPPLLFDGAFRVWGYRALSFLVVSCPCALVISVPLTFFCGIGAASRHGILIKGAEYVEQLARVKTIAFDKTGTLTAGCFSVVAVKAERGEERDVLRIAAALERGSRHPIAKGVVAAYKGDLPIATRVSEHSGKGVVALIDEEECVVGSASFLSEFGVFVNEEPRETTIIHVAKGGVYLGNVTLCDEVKAEAKRVIASLKRSGITHTVMLTGDNESLARQIGAIVGVDEVRAQLLPDEKVACLETLMRHDGCVAFVGDGINDAPVLARADVGVAMGGIGSDAAIESADIVLMEDRLEKLPLAIRIARKTLRIVRQNIVLALCAKGVILLLATMGIVNMWVAVFGDVGIMLLAVLNALRSQNV